MNNKNIVDDKYYMNMALKLASAAEGYTAPNPMVGAVIVNDNVIVGKGCHTKAGENHAEVNAIIDAAKRTQGATLYVTLEPCCHYGKTPPCTEFIIKAGISRVVVAMQDPNPKVSGKGIDILRKAGIKVDVGILEEEAKCLNEAFIKFISSDFPFVVLKVAVSLDGKIATVAGESKWITGTESRGYVHKLRHKYDAVLVGINTVRKDDPKLNVRLDDKNNSDELYIDPIRIILDSKCSIEYTAYVVNNEPQKTIIATTDIADVKKIQNLREKGLRVLVLPDKNGRVDIKALLKELAKMNITSVLVEGGAEVHGSFLYEKLVDRVYWFIAPMIIGGKDAPSAVGGIGIHKLTDASKLKKLEVMHFGQDICITGLIGGE